MPNKCYHENTYFIDYPDSFSIEVCEDCEKARSHWESNPSFWIVSDIEKDKKEHEKSLSGLSKIRVK